MVSSLNVVAVSFVILTFPIKVESYCTRIWINPTIITRSNTDKLKANITSSNGQFPVETVVKLDCVSSSYRINGTSISRCLANGSWDENPNCVLRAISSKKEPLPWLIIGGSAGGGVVFIVIVTILVVCLCKRKKKTSGEDRTKNTHVREDDSVPFKDIRNSDLINNHIGMRRSDGSLYHELNYGKHDYGNHFHDSRYASAGSINKYRHHDGISLVGSNASVIGTSNIPIFKVWTCRRTRRKFIKAENLAVLQRKAATIYQYDNPVRLTLEEDGTDVDNDDILASCIGKILVVLARNEHWVDRSGVSNLPIQKYTFDVCSHDRTLRKLVLAENLKDLIHQAPAYFGYIVNEICIESDGTMIGDDDILISMSSQTVMALGKDESWTPATDKMVEIENKVATTSTDTPTLSDLPFKVWSEDQSKKKMIKAENCIDLHIKGAASKELGLEMPIQIRVKDEDIVISTDIVLQTNLGKILIASQRNAPKWLETNKSSYTLQNDSQNDYNSADLNGYSSVEQLQRTDAPSETRSHDYGPMRQPYISNQRAVKSTDFKNNGKQIYFDANIDRKQSSKNDPDIVQSTQFSMPSRYESENPLYHDRTISEGLRNPLGQSHTGKTQKDKHIYKDVTESYDDPANSENVRNYKDFDNSNDLPYSDLTPSYQLNFGKPDKSDQMIPDEEKSNELPYSDLEPLHKKNGRKGNNFDVLRKQNMKKGSHNDQDSESEYGRKQSSLFRQPSFLVTGGAKQSNDSDVLF
ncbi:unnamed protein product [Mytilus coruscus]|uniref:Sushi domain-containing protein n=1 Tax=Mytilus coruscus TaxID=42192 RepID=A0A6J8ESP0_MYTCO|nr:unnamed protein product [Mytilus coruscus]